ncbi:DNA-directed RNA polymerase I subunit 1-like protein, partial [Drosera capensis]
GKAKSRTGEDEAAKSKIGEDEAKSKFGKDYEAKSTTFATIDPVETIDEDVVLVYKNELVQGVIDKDQFAKYGLVLTVHELYGPKTAGKLLSVLGRVLTTFLQIHGFTCGVDDLLLKKEEDKHRNELLENALNCGEK